MQQQGSTLIEHLVALIIFSVGLLGLLKAQLFALNHYQTAYRYLLAVNQVTALLENYQALPVMDLVHDWNKENSQLLPQAIGEISLNYSLIIIQLHWWQQGRKLPSLSCKTNYQCIQWIV